MKISQKHRNIGKLIRGLSQGILIGGMIAGVALPAIAGYRPPKNQKPPKTAGTTTGIRRGCFNQSAATLTAIAPQSHVGLTVSSQPTFVWFIPEDKPVEMEFELYELTDTGRQTLLQRRFQSQPGLMSLALDEVAQSAQPSAAPIRLAVGKRYFWQVIAYCNPNRPSSALVASAELEVSPMPKLLAQQVNALSNTPLRQADALAEAGFWYDALALNLNSPNSQPLMAQSSLLEDLAALEATPQKQRLKAIIDSK